MNLRTRRIKHIQMFNVNLYLNCCVCDNFIHENCIDRLKIRQLVLAQFCGLARFRNSRNSECSFTILSYHTLGTFSLHNKKEEE
jgi:hypothetical protein